MWYIILILIILDGLIIYYIPSYFNNINFLYPMLTLSLISVLANNLSLKKYYQTVFIMGIIYDILYSNIFLYNAFLFLLISKINTKIYKVLKHNLFLVILITILNIIIYDTITFLLIKFSSYQSVDFIDLIYKIKNSLLLNILIVFVYYFYFKKKNIHHKIKW